MPSNLFSTTIGTANVRILSSQDGTVQVLISYKTAVAALIGGTVYFTDKKWTVTTRKHLAWFYSLVGITRERFERSQAWFDKLVNVATDEWLDNVPIPATPSTSTTPQPGAHAAEWA